MTPQFELFQSGGKVSGGSQAPAEELSKEAGISRASENNKEALKTAQTIAFELAREKGQVSVEDVRAVLQKARNHVVSGNWMGQIFRDKKKWERVGFIKATHEKSHSRLIGQWQLREK